MDFKRLFLLSLSILAVSGILLAVGGHYWRKHTDGSGNANRELPAASAEYGRILERLRVQDTAMDISGTIRIYDEEKDDRLKETSIFRSVRRGVQYYSQLSSLRTYCDGSLVLMVDSVHRRMVVSRVETGGTGVFDPSRMSAALLFSDTARFRFTGSVEERQAGRELTIHSDYNPEIKECRIFYDTVTYRPRLTEIERWKDGAGLEGQGSKKIWLAKVEYGYRSRGNIDIGAEMRSFISMTKTGIKPTARYMDFDLKTNF